MHRDNQKVEFIQELYDTYEDIRQGNVTLKRIYVILIITIIMIFSMLGVSMLFTKEFFISSLYFIFAILFYILLLNRKKKSIAKHLHWYSFLGGSLTVIISIFCNVYLYSLAAGSQLYVLLLTSLIYIIFISDDKKRFLVAHIVFFVLCLIFVSLVFIDNYFWHTESSDNPFFTFLYIVSVSIVFFGMVFAINVVGLRSIEDVEKLSLNQNRVKTRFQTYNKYKVIDKKDFAQVILQKQLIEYNHLNICIFEMSLMQKRKDAFFKIDHYYQNKIINELISLLRVYYPIKDIKQKDPTLLIKWDLNSIILITEENSSDFYFALESITKDFDKMIRQKKDSFEVYLKIVAKYYKELNTSKRPKIVLEKINEVIKLKYETKTMGKEYILYKSGYDEPNIRV